MQCGRCLDPSRSCRRAWEPYGVLSQVHCSEATLANLLASSELPNNLIGLLLGVDGRQRPSGRCGRRSQRRHGCGGMSAVLPALQCGRSGLWAV